MCQSNMLKTKNYKSRLFNRGSSTKSGLKTERGVSLYIILMIMAMLLGIGFGMSALLLSQLDTLKGVGYSVLAFYATDAGIEKTVYVDNKFCGSIQNSAQRLTCLRNQIAVIPPAELAMSNGAQYVLTIEPQGGACIASTYCVKSVGTYKQSRRAVRVGR